MISVNLKRKHEENDSLLKKENSKHPYMRRLAAYKNKKHKMTENEEVTLAPDVT